MKNLNRKPKKGSDLLDKNNDSDTELKETYFINNTIISTWIFRIVGVLLGLLGLYSILKILVEYFVYSNTIEVYYTDALFIIFCIYFASWVKGAESDIKTFNNSFKTAPNLGKIPKKGLFYCVILAIIFGFIVIFKNEIQWVSAALLIFLLINYIGWYYLRDLYKVTINQDIIQYLSSREYIKYEILEEVKEYLLGSWQKSRYTFAFIVLIGINIMVNTPLNSSITTMLDFKSQHSLPVTIICLYIGIFELWIWSHRLKRDYLIEGYSALDKNYTITKENTS